MPAITRASGLCAACSNEISCIFAPDRGTTVLNCEQFELGFRFTPPPYGHAAEPRPPAVASTPIGLCSNCDNRATCIYPKLDGGVWHCEEYR